MRERITIIVDGARIPVESGTSLAAALLNVGVSRFRRSERGEQRAPLCGMGVCFDCRVTVGGARHLRACLVNVEDGMEVSTDS